MSGAGRRWLSDDSAGLVTMHGKEAVIGPVLSRGAGISLFRVAGVDTDAFGTFTREVERPGTALDAARTKVQAGFAASPETRIMVASEGSFGPHPALPLLPFGDELVLLVDRETGFELTGRHVGPETNFAYRRVRDVETALDFARRCGFPGHGMIVLGACGEAPAPHLFCEKAPEDEAALASAAARAIALTGAAFLETDMRAHRNPTRQDAIRRAAQDLVRRLGSPCPACTRPGFDRRRRISGLPCSDCGTPTDMTAAWVHACEGCGLEDTRPVAGEPWADPGSCPSCNP
jgi:hypothetical protein